MSKRGGDRSWWIKFPDALVGIKQGQRKYSRQLYPALYPACIPYFLSLPLRSIDFFEVFASVFIFLFGFEYTTTQAWLLS